MTTARRAARQLVPTHEPGAARLNAFRILVGLLSLLFGLGFVALTALTVAVWAADPRSSETNPVVDIGFFGLGGVIVGLGFAAQLRTPERHLAGLLQSLIGLCALAAAGFLGQRVEPLWAGTFAVLASVAAIALHPARHLFFRRQAEGSRLLAAFAAAAAVPALYYAERMVALARDAGPSCFAGQCARGDRFAEMAALAVAVVLVSLLASTGTRGWRLSAWSAGIAAILVGLASVVLPDATGSLGLLPGLLVVVWAGALLATTEWQARRPRSDGQEPIEGTKGIPMMTTIETDHLAGEAWHQRPSRSYRPWTGGSHQHERPRLTYECRMSSGDAIRRKAG